jgi:DNA polymerase-3 subunit gamma/tau
MEWIVKQEGIEAGPEVLSVLAQAGEGSVRDSLSALDQAIACCGARLEASEVRGLLGMFSLDALDQVAKALVASDSHRMLEVVAELEANGRSLQHFARELARYFRNLLVVRIAGSVTRLVAASPAEQQRLAETAAQFSEEDLTRYLQLTLDLFRDLQSSLQPRLHLEMGLLRMVHAGRLQPIEEALASLSGAGSGPAPKAVPPKMAPPAAAPAKLAALDGTDTRSQLHRALIEAKLTHVADALEHSELAERENELVFTTPKMYTMYLKQAEFAAAVQRVVGRPVRITIKGGERSETSAASQPAPPDDEVATRALSHPEVRRFQEMFPESQVRTVRNLRETQS